MTESSAPSEFRFRLPRSVVVERIEFLRQKVADKRAIHVGFADAMFREDHAGSGRWLHACLADRARELIGVDIDEKAVDLARRQGYEAYCADCSNESSLRALDLQPAEIVIAGEVIEHVDNPGTFLRGLHHLTAPNGTLVITTPNAYGWLNPVAAVLGYEFVNPDHVTVFSCFTLTNLLARNGWKVDEILTYTTRVRSREGRKFAEHFQARVAQVLLGFSHKLARLHSPFVADGLIAVCSPADSG